MAVEWVLAHMGIHGNESADKIAKFGSLKPTIELPIIFYLNDVMSFMASVQSRHWQQFWACSFPGRSFY